MGRLDILVNNAGRSQRARWEHTDIKVDEDLFALNVFSVVNLTRVVLPHMLERGSGCIALMSSSAGKAGVPFSGTYTGSKHALPWTHLFKLAGGGGHGNPRQEFW